MVKNYKIFLFAALPSTVMAAIMLLLYPFFLHPQFIKEIVLEAQENSQRVSSYFIKEYYEVLFPFALPVKKSVMIKDTGTR